MINWNTNDWTRSIQEVERMNYNATTFTLPNWMTKKNKINVKDQISLRSLLVAATCVPLLVPVKKIMTSLNSSLWAETWGNATPLTSVSTEWKWRHHYSFLSIYIVDRRYRYSGFDNSNTITMHASISGNAAMLSRTWNKASGKLETSARWS